MPHVFIEGIDRSGKSTVADRYRKKGYEVVHMSAPDKKYYQKGYVGPSYLDELAEMMMQYDGKNVVFDRTQYGELIWPLVFGGRESLLSEEDLEILKDFESRNSAEYYLMHDEDVEAHWNRCVENKEPLTRRQFDIARIRYEELVDHYGFSKVQLKDFDHLLSEEESSKDDSAERQDDVKGEVEDVQSSNPSPSTVKTTQETENLTDQQKRLQKANAINSLLSKRIVKQRGQFFDDLEKDIKGFLNSKLEALLGNESKSLTQEEIDIVKLFCERIKQRS